VTRETCPGRAVVWGAGGVGRGFIGHLLCRSGFIPSFVDVNDSLVRQINERGEYVVRLAKEGEQEERVGPVEACTLSELERIQDWMSRSDLIFTAVGAAALDSIAPLVAAGLRARWSRGISQPCNLFLCENLHQVGPLFKEKVASCLSEPVREEILSRTGFSGVVVGRMIPVLPQGMGQEDPLLVLAEDYWNLPVDAQGTIAPVPQVEGMVLAEDFPAEEARKLYTHNMLHAASAYHGYLFGHTWIAQATMDERILTELEQAARESNAGLLASYDLDEEVQRGYAATLLERFKNPFLLDTVLRVGRDPMRKLRSSDRLIGAARLALNAGVIPQALVSAIVAAFRFDPKEDRSAQELQQRLHDEGIRGVLQGVCGLFPDDPLFDLVLQAWEGG